MITYNKVSQKLHQREVTQKLRKGQQYFLYVTLPLNLISIAVMIHQDIPYNNLLMVGTRSVKNLIKREVTKKVRKGEQSFMHVTCRLYLIYIAIKFHQDILYCYLIMACKRVVWKKLTKGKQFID